jgi:hypothetical protein
VWGSCVVKPADQCVAPDTDPLPDDCVVMETGSREGQPRRKRQSERLDTDKKNGKKKG